MDDVMVKVEGAGKVFRLPHEKQTSIKGTLIHLFRRGKTSYEEQRALRNVSFEIKKGEFFGIVGRNGSGKSTLLKLLAGIYTPTTGSIKVNGKLTPFIELGVGFNQELTGRENVYLNGALLGFSRNEMAEMYDDIVEFAELQRFMDQKLKNYSSGMQVRLAFSIAIRARSDILLLDEVLAVGDAAFQKKCFDYFYELKKRGTTVCFVSHDMATVERFCTRAIYIEAGEVIGDDEPGRIADIYRAKNEAAIAKSEGLTGAQKRETDAATIKVVPMDSTGKETQLISSKHDICFSIDIHAKKNIQDGLVSFTIENENAATIVGDNSHRLGVGKLRLKPGDRKQLMLRIQNVFGEGKYVLDVEVATETRDRIFGHVDNAASFKVVDYGNFPWLLRPDITMRVEK